MKSNPNIDRTKIREKALTFIKRHCINKGKWRRLEMALEAIERARADRAATEKINSK
jgi:hypothetical protein